MNIRLVGQIFRKDVEKSWWLIALTLVLLARLAWFDSLRDSAIPGSEEGWLNILLPLAWSLLIAVVLLEDPAEGNTPFWRTLPCRWPSVLAAKSLLAAVFIHLPYLLACCSILQARQFAPIEHLPELLGRQCVLLVLTLSSFALASLVLNVTGFLTMAIPIATIIVASSRTSGYAAAQPIRDFLALSAVTVAAIVIAIERYRFRSGRQVGRFCVYLVLLAAVIWRLPSEKFHGLEAALDGAPAGVSDLSIRQAAPVGVPKKWGVGDGFEQVAVPIAVTGTLGNYQVRLVLGVDTLSNAEGDSYSSHSSRRGLGWGRVVASFGTGGGLPSWLLLTVDRKIMAHDGNSPVKLNGSVLAEYYRLARPVQMAIETNTPVAGLGRCSSGIIAGNSNAGALRVDCESPGAIPMTGIVLTDPATGREWHDDLRSSATFLDNPGGAWLSPVNRSDVFFDSTDEEHYRMQDRPRMVPIEVLHAVRITVTPQIPEGRKVVDYELPGIRLNDFLVGR